MAKTKIYQHFCPVARSLEVIGEKWSLLIVRDLLRGTMRFTDLKTYLGGISPKWLSLRLRELERVGIVERQSQPGRREVWYRLTDKGRDLEPVIAGLAVWGVDHALRAPAPGEPVYPEQTLSAMRAYLDASEHKPRRALTWVIRFPESTYTLAFDTRRWAVHTSEVANADVLVETSPSAWVAMLTSSPVRRGKLIDQLRMVGSAAAVAAFRRTLLRSAPPGDRRRPTTARRARTKA